MNKVFIGSGFIAIIFLLVKFIESKYITKINKPIKDLIRDTTFVYVSSLAGLFLIDNIKLSSISSKSTGNNTVKPPAFVDNPTF